MIGTEENYQTSVQSRITISEVNQLYAKQEPLKEGLTRAHNSSTDWLGGHQSYEITHIQELDWSLCGTLICSTWQKPITWHRRPYHVMQDKVAASELQLVIVLKKAKRNSLGVSQTSERSCQSTYIIINSRTSTETAFYFFLSTLFRRNKETPSEPISCSFLSYHRIRSADVAL